MPIDNQEDWIQPTTSNLTCQKCGTAIYKYSDNNDPYATTAVHCKCSVPQPVPVFMSPVEMQLAVLSAQVEELKNEVAALKKEQQRTSRSTRQILKDTIRYK